MHPVITSHHAHIRNGTHSSTSIPQALRHPPPQKFGISSSIMGPQPQQSTQPQAPRINAVNLSIPPPITRCVMQPRLHTIQDHPGIIFNQQSYNNPKLVRVHYVRRNSKRNSLHENQHHHITKSSIINPTLSNLRISSPIEHLNSQHCRNHTSQYPQIASMPIDEHLNSNSNLSKIKLFHGPTSCEGSMPRRILLNQTKHMSVSSQQNQQLLPSNRNGENLGMYKKNKESPITHIGQSRNCSKNIGYSKNNVHDFVQVPGAVISSESNEMNPTDACNLASTSSAILDSQQVGSNNTLDKADIVHDQKNNNVAIVESRQILPKMKEKTPMCLVNELARFNKIQHQYRLTNEEGPAHKKNFTVTLKLGVEEYTSDGPSIKKAQHAAAGQGIQKTKYKHPTEKKNYIKLPRGLEKNNSSPKTLGHITPTVALNALAMKRCEATVYVVEQSPHINHSQISRKLQNTEYVKNSLKANTRSENQKGLRAISNLSSKQICFNNDPLQSKDELYRVSLKVGDRTFCGAGNTSQAARHAAAAKALIELKSICPETQPESIEKNLSDESSIEHKSPISLVHEMALKRNMHVTFEVQSEKGPAHMKTFVTACCVGNITTEGEGNGKKLSKKRAAAKMLEELRTILPDLPVADSSHLPYKQVKKKNKLVKKKTKNIIKENLEQEYKEYVNPISKLLQIQQSQKKKEPVYTLINERGIGRQREFVMEVSIGTLSAKGAGINKKIAKRIATENILKKLEVSPSEHQHINYTSVNSVNPESIDVGANTIESLKDTFKSTDSAWKTKSLIQGVGNNIISGSLLVRPKINEDCSNYSASIAGPCTLTTNISMEKNKYEIIPTITSNTTHSVQLKQRKQKSNLPTLRIRPKAQLLYIANILNIDIQFDDFPKGNHKEFLSLITMVTEPCLICHGNGHTIEESHDRAASNALKMLSEMGLDNIVSTSSNDAQQNQLVCSNSNDCILPDSNALNEEN